MSTNIAAIHLKATEAFESGKTRDIAFREQQLRALMKCCDENEDLICKVLATDLRKSRQESIITELEMLRNEIRNHLMNLRKFAKPERPAKASANMLDDVVIHKEPYGVVLVIGPWNYPIQLSLLPFAGAIAAGNSVILKPSEVAAHASKFIDEVIPKYLDQECYHIVTGGAAETTELLQFKFDYIFYTGSTRVGQIVHAAANKHLTPVTLELGGKSPCYVDSTADLRIAVKRIVWGKLINSGQTCIAPDYLLCTKAVQVKFLEEVKRVLNEFYGEDRQKSPDLCRIINRTQFERLKSFVDGADIAVGGQMDADQLYIEPTILVNVKPDDAVMQAEVFGPILPIINVENAYDAVQFINARDRPLAVYVFTKNREVQDLFIGRTFSGSVCVNDTVMQFVVDTLPFGGIGPSGMGAYHGQYSLDTFTHKKGCLVKNFNPMLELIASARYPPYSASKTNYLIQLLKRRASIPSVCVHVLALIGFGAVSLVLFKLLRSSRR